MLTMPTELKAKQTYKCLIYGQPGTGKTTCALSSPKPVLIDFEEGIYRVETRFRIPSIQVKSTNEVLDFLNSKESEQFETIVIDTLGRFVDCIIEDVKKQLNKSQISIKDWGTVKIKFNNIMKAINSSQKSVIFVAHEKEEKDGDKRYKRPQTGSGSSGDSLINDMDLVGYISMIGNTRTIDFSPAEDHYAKNSLQLEPNMVIDDTKKGNYFMSEKIIKASNEKIKSDAELREKYNELLDLIKDNVNNLNTIEDINNFYNNYKNYEIIWDSKYQGDKMFMNKVKELNFTFNKTTKIFE